LGTALWPLCPVAVADFILARQMPAQVVGEPTRQVVDSFLFDQPIRGIVGKAISRVVFVDEGSQSNRFVVLVTDALAFGVLAARWESARRAKQTRPGNARAAPGCSTTGLDFWVASMIVWGRPSSDLRYGGVAQCINFGN